MASPAFASDVPDTVARVKRSIVAIGTFDPARVPKFAYRGTGFATGDGQTIVTNAHVVAKPPAPAERLGVMVPAAGETDPRFREALRVTAEARTDLAMIRVDGPPLPALRIDDTDGAREGQPILFTGFPIGSVLGLFAATHSGIVAAITPIAMPQARASELTTNALKQLASGGLRLLQLDAIAYPGNSGSPVYDPATGVVLGVVNMVVTRDTKESGLAHPSGITYAVPARHVRDLIANTK